MTAADEVKRLEGLRARLALLGWCCATVRGNEGVSLALYPAAHARHARTLEQAEAIVDILERHAAQRAEAQRAAA